MEEYRNCDGGKNWSIACCTLSLTTTRTRRRNCLPVVEMAASPEKLTNASIPERISSAWHNREACVSDFPAATPSGEWQQRVTHVGYCRLRITFRRGRVWISLRDISMSERRMLGLCVPYKLFLPPERCIEK